MLTELARQIYKMSKEHGWWDPEPSFGETVALCHSELSESLEEYRNNSPHIYFKDRKPEGIAVEMADCIIRILDWFGHEGIDVDEVVKEKMEYNQNREYRHGGKKL